MRFVIRPMHAGELTACEKILRGLPDWFGIEDAIVNYVRDIQSMETLIAESHGDDKLIGFLTLNHHNNYSTEIQVMAVASAYHGQGCGRQLVVHAERMLISRSVEFLQVKTLAPTQPSTHYQRTRRFYNRMGFKPLEVNLLWGEQNPCLIMVKHLSPK